MEVSILNGYKIKDKKAIRYYDTVQDMKEDDTLKEGMHAKTKGYYAVNDGGGAEYHITATESVLDHQEELENELYATLIIKGVAYIKQYGAYGDGVHDDTNAIQEALNTDKDLLFSNGIYLISETLKFRGNKNIKFVKNAKVITNTALTYMFEFNNEVDAIISQNCKIENACFDGNDIALNGVILSNYVNLYIDNLQIFNVTTVGLTTKGNNSRQHAELRITKSNIRNYNYAYENSIGIQVDSSDGTYNNMSVVDFETAFKINHSGNSFTDLHPWIHFKELWNNSKAFVLPSNGGDLTIINGGFIDSIRTAFTCNSGILNVSNMIIYYANTLYGDKAHENTSATFNEYIVNNPAQIFMGTNSTRLRISNIFSYIQGGSSNVITNIVNPDNSVSNCLFNPDGRWIGTIIDYSRTIKKDVVDTPNITSSYKYCTKTGRLVTLQYRGTLNNFVNGFTTIATLPFKPVNEVFFSDAQGKQLYISTAGYLQGAENLQADTNIRFTVTYLGTLNLS